MRKRPFQRPVALTVFNRGCASVCDWVSVVMNGYPLKAERCRSGTLTQFYCVTNGLTASGVGFVIWRDSVARIRGAVALPHPRLGSGDADVGRASQLQHAVQDRDADVHLRGLTLVRARAAVMG